MNNELLTFARNHVWHPYDSLKDPIPALDVVRAAGTTLYLSDGRELTDGMSGWWSVCHGYGHPVIISEMEKQLRRMSHVMFAGLIHEPAAEVARRLSAMTPQGLSDVFFADSGSVAVEIALKMAVQYQESRMPSRKRFLTVRGGYHGDTLGAMSVTDPGNGFSGSLGWYIPEQIFISRPGIPFGAPWDAGAMDELHEALERYQDEIAGFILEPVMQGAGGMYFYHPEYLRAARKLTRDYDVIFICDEIATGFGRTGEMFACDYAGISPDIMTLGKGLTGGMISLSAVLTGDKIREGVHRSSARALMHGPTFMANPLAVSAALGSLKALESYDWRARVHHIEEILKRELAPLAASPLVRETRVLGAVGAVEMRQPVHTAAMQAFLTGEGVWLRPFGNIVYIYPPFVITDEDLLRCVRSVEKLISGMEKGVIRGFRE
ncbi:adenosylmethionine--8-amino-7-oxononanoate transaminase [Succinimonas sp.]|uniref:adenosylmethionine--8-amino-7-oxononanoate transaminase n=1 Tax=Succinimonas sp. TaxID=1936151 RepID=UPI00386F87DA